MGERTHFYASDAQDDLSRGDRYQAGILGYDKSSWKAVAPEEEATPDDDWDGENPLNDEVGPWLEKTGFGHLLEILEDEGVRASL
eukprot:SAG31_NODE_1476_length_8195_cov_2.521863_8_plen_85_part_00